MRQNFRACTCKKLFLCGFFTGTISVGSHEPVPARQQRAGTNEEATLSKFYVSQQFAGTKKHKAHQLQPSAQLVQSGWMSDET